MRDLTNKIYYDSSQVPYLANTFYVITLGKFHYDTGIFLTFGSGCRHHDISKRTRRIWSTQCILNMLATCSNARPCIFYAFASIWIVMIVFKAWSRLGALI